VIPRAYIHVGGPARSGKTAFIEAILKATDELLVARCHRKDRLKEPHETEPHGHPELRRYRDAGARGVAAFEFPSADDGHDAFFMTELMADYSRGVIVEGDNPLAYLDVDIFIAPPPSAGEQLFVKRHRDSSVKDRATIARWREMLAETEGVARWMGEVMGVPAGGIFKEKPQIVESSRAKLLETLEAAAKARPAMPTEQWVIADRYRGIENAGLVVVNVRSSAERTAGEALVADLSRLRKDDELFTDILGVHGHRTPITSVVANLRNPDDPGRKKAIARVRRGMRTALSKL